jgi:putative toxin-antitoxin system antitoxin component (TIGR02293 family)
MSEIKNSAKVYQQYRQYLLNDDLNMVSEPEVIYATAFDDMIAVANYDKDFAADLLDVSYKTITRYKKNSKKFSPLQSEYILKTIVLYNKGESVFGSFDSFNKWLNKPAFGLGNRIPNSFITTVTGINHILDELNRIAHGDLA